VIIDFLPITAVVLGFLYLFYHEEPPKTIPTSVVWCPRCGMLAERSDSEVEGALEAHKQ